MPESTVSPVRGYEFGILIPLFSTGRFYSKLNLHAIAVRMYVNNSANIWPTISVFFISWNLILFKDDGLANITEDTVFVQEN
jgi:hypothetical protein